MTNVGPGSIPGSSAEPDLPVVRLCRQLPWSGCGYIRSGSGDFRVRSSDGACRRTDHQRRASWESPTTGSKSVSAWMRVFGSLVSRHAKCRIRYGRCVGLWDFSRPQPNCGIRCGLWWRWFFDSKAHVVGLRRDVAHGSDRPGAAHRREVDQRHQRKRRVLGREIGGSRDR